MRFPALVLISTIFFTACNSGEKIPDVSGIRIDLKTERFEKDLFALDTNHIDAGLNNLSAKYPGFFPDFIGAVLGIDNDMLQKGTGDTAIRSFIASYKALYDSVNKQFGNFEKQQGEIRQVLQFTKYYFPNYQAPTKIITFIGPMDANFPTSLGVQSDFVTDYAIGAGLQLHLGKDFFFYKTAQGQELYPEYISRQFEPGFIAINTARNIVDRLYPDSTGDQPLVELMVEKGRKLYVLGKLLPYTKPNQLINYSEQDYLICQNNEAVIWDLFIQNNFLQVSDKNVVKNYVSEGPKTQEIVNADGVNAPGNIGSYAGWQIVKKYMSRNPKTTLQQLMSMKAEDIYSNSKYKP